MPYLRGLEGVRKFHEEIVTVGGQQYTIHTFPERGLLLLNI